MRISITDRTVTLTQLEHIVALEKYRHFGKAAEHCNITQSTLSISIQKLEQELDMEIFDRSTHPIKITEIGKEIIIQAKVVIMNSKILSEIARSRKTEASGEIRLGLIGSVSVYLLPKIYKFLSQKFPKVKVNAQESQSSSLIQKLKLTELDCAIMASNLGDSNLLEIPLYKEEMMGFVSQNDPLYDQEILEIDNLPLDRMWRMLGQHSPGNNIVPVAENGSINMAGTVETLIRIVRENGGFTIVPDTHIPLMRKEFQDSIRPLEPKSYRDISLYIRRDYVSERLLNILVEAIKFAVPEKCINSPILNQPIKL